MFFPLLFPPILQLRSPSLLGLEPSQNPWCLILGPNEARTLDVSLQKNSVRDTAIGKIGGFVWIQRESLSKSVGHHRGKQPWNMVWLVF